jgi:ketosteroid isomerase-like protein
MEHPNAALMHKADELLDAGDFPAFLALHSEDVVMHVPGNGPLSGDHHGTDARQGAALCPDGSLIGVTEPATSQPGFPVKSRLAPR